jgi:hypothetical protein
MFWIAISSAPDTTILLATQLQREDQSKLEHTCSLLFQSLANRASGKCLEAADLTAVLGKLLLTSCPVPRYFFRTKPPTTIQLSITPSPRAARSPLEISLNTGLVLSISGLLLNTRSANGNGIQQKGGGCNQLLIDQRWR